MIDNLIYILAITIIIFLVILAIINRSFQISRNEFLSDKEKRLFNLLIDAFPEMYVFPHVSCATIIEPNKHIKNIKQKKMLMKKLSQQFFLFSLFYKDNMEFLCAVEFAANEKEIMRNDGIKLQKLIEDAKIKTLRISPFGFVDKDILRQQLSNLLRIELASLKSIKNKSIDSDIDVVDFDIENSSIDNFKGNIEKTEFVKLDKNIKNDQSFCHNDVDTNIVFNPAFDNFSAEDEQKKPYWKK